MQVYFPGENHRNLDDFLVSVRVELGVHLPLVDDILTKLPLAFVNQLHSIELGETVVRTRDVVVQSTVLQLTRSDLYLVGSFIYLQTEGIVLNIIK